jgi:hypothetical protein
MRHSRLLIICVAALLGTTCNLSNKAPAVPTVTGPTSGVAGTAVTFTATTTDPDVDSVAYQFDWGDGSTPAWTSLVASGDAITVTNTYTDSGTFTVKAKAKDKGGKESVWSEGHSLSLIPGGPAYPDTVVDSLALPWFVLSSCISRDGSLLGLGSNSGDDSVAIVGTSSMALVGGASVGGVVAAIALSPDDRYAYFSVAMHDTGYISQLDVARSSVVAATRVSGLSYQITVASDGGRVMVAVGAKVLFLDSDSLRVTDSVIMPYGVTWLVLNQSGTALYVSTLHGIGIIDVAGCSLRVFSQAVDNGWTEVLSSDEQLLYTFSQADSGLAILRADDLSVVRRVNLHLAGLWDMAASPDGHYLYVSSSGLRVYDIGSMRQIDSLTLPSNGRPLVHPGGDSLYYVEGRAVYVIGKRQ